MATQLAAVASNSPEVWGGVECTVARIGDRWTDQVRRTGHARRLDDLDRFAGLGLKALRVPLLWERTEIEPGVFDWSWADACMARMASLGLRPIAGLVHHGSGPRWTSLGEDSFAPGLAAFAGRAAARYPWVRDWTPVNEPLTTARFAGLYGHWHPHAADEGVFWRLFLNQIDAVVRSMAGIRAVIPGARLVQTEDFGVTYGTAPCADQVRHENLRRLATWDVLAGALSPDHGLYDHLAGFGLAGRLDALRATPTPADLIGVNHYVTSDRFLDHRLERYEAHRHGGNGRLRYADLEAVRVRGDDPDGWGPLFEQLWARYRRPLAVTECHIGCAVDQQILWLHECWDAACRARAAGMPVEAVTVWALLGAFDWDSLLTRDAGHYEPGAFDISGGAPRATALAAAVSALATRGRPPEPADAGCRGGAWWRRADRFDPAPA
jgi:beta-glucosidase/6-phospho-beta-glucosidase/beta-galactosidase